MNLMAISTIPFHAHRNLGQDPEKGRQLEEAFDEMEVPRKRLVNSSLVGGDWWWLEHDFWTSFSHIDVGME